MSGHKHFTLAADGLLAMARIFVSCRPIMGGILTANQVYLIRHAKAGRDIALSEFMRSLPIADPTYELIAAFADGLGTHRITEDVVYGFFGGQPHFDKILGQIHEFKLKREFADRIFVAHILLPVVVTSDQDAESRVSALYRNGKVEVVLKNLVPSNGVAVSRDGSALAHYATIIDAYVSDSDAAHLLKIQAQQPEFMAACRRVKQLDYLDFWDLCRWTQGKNQACEL